jgi:hypothetical protein
MLCVGMLNVAYKPFMLSVIMLNVVILSAVTLNDVMLSVVAPIFGSVGMTYQKYNHYLSGA